LTIHVHEAEKLSLKQIEAFLNASQEIQFKGETQKADLSLDRAGAGPAGVPPAEPPRARFVTQLCGEDDGPEPGAGDAVDRSLS
jgi:hypothetical protein